MTNLSNPTDPAVLDALTRTCCICQVEPDNLVRGSRWAAVDRERVQQAGTRGAGEGMSDHHHYVRHMVDHDVISTEFRCDAPEMASCRAFCQCVRNGREYCGCDEPVLADVGYCNILAFLEDAPDECFNGAKQSARTGWSPITLAWEGDYYTWDYAEAEQ